MDSLEPQDRMRLNAAEGWLELGNHIEAMAELDKITPAASSHPEVLEVRYEIFARAKHWEACADIAGAILKSAPESLFGWIRRSFALHELNRSIEALERLQPAVDHFPDEIVVRYNLACYECVLGNMGQAKQRLAETFKLARKQKCYDAWRLQALEDPDLQSLRAYLKQL